jgi:hypothetical protein
VAKETGRGENPRPDRVSINVRVTRVTAEKLRTCAEGPRKAGELINRLVNHWNKRP